MLPIGKPIALLPANCTAPVPLVLKIMLALDDTAELLADIVTLLMVRLPTLPPPPGAETPNAPIYSAPLTYTLLPVKLTPLGKLVPMKFNTPD